MHWCLKMGPGHQPSGQHPHQPGALASGRGASPDHLPLCRSSTACLESVESMLKVPPQYRPPPLDCKPELAAFQTLLLRGNRTSVSEQNLCAVRRSLLSSSGLGRQG